MYFKSEWITTQVTAEPCGTQSTFCRATHAHQLLQKWPVTSELLGEPAACALTITLPKRMPMTLPPRGRVVRSLAGRLCRG